jgi:uncharacterized protein (TIGR00297 family)
MQNYSRDGAGVGYAQVDCKSLREMRLAMDEEIRGAGGDAGWRKAIPKERDRLQSRVLVGVVAPLLVGMTILTLIGGYARVDRFTTIYYSSLAVSVAFAIIVFLLRAATPAGAACGGMICYDLTLLTSDYGASIGRTALIPLATLFLLTFFSTRAGKGRKANAGLSERHSGRNAAQVIANLFVAALCVTPVMMIFIHLLIEQFSFEIFRMMKVMCVAALAEATADTVSSEMGQAFGGHPVLIVGLRRVEPGTDGAVTLLGTCAGVAAAALVAIAGGWAIHLSLRVVLTALGAGICGLFFDSFLGATVERRGWIGNDLVNFTSTLFAAILAAVVYRFFV